MRAIGMLLLLGLAGLCADARAGEDRLRVLVFGDPQVESVQDVDYYRRDIGYRAIGRNPAGVPGPG